MPRLTPVYTLIASTRQTWLLSLDNFGCFHLSRIGPGLARLWSLSNTLESARRCHSNWFHELGEIMRVYHFVTAEYGLDDISRRRLKIATINELNDPFELLAVNLADPELRRAFTTVKQQLAAASGMLCFCRHWRNPVPWSHYAGKHTGLCLGFDVPNEHLTPVSYTGRRLAIEAERLLHPRSMDETLARKFISTKFSHWRYEAEIRAFLSLEDRDPDTGLYYVEFSDRLALKEVIVGANSSISRSQLSAALAELAPSVRVLKARLAFETFSVVCQRNADLWQ